MSTTERLQNLAHEELVPAPPIEHLRRRIKTRRNRHRIGVSLAASALAAAGFLLATNVVGHDDPQFRVAAGGHVQTADVPEGVTLTSIEDRATFLVRTGDRLVAFAARTTHLPGEPLWWCPAEQLFSSPFHGEVWDRDGRVTGGPPPRGLDRYVVRTTSTGWIIDTSQVLPGPPPPAETGLHSPIEDGGCRGALKSAGASDGPEELIFPVGDQVNVWLTIHDGCADVLGSAGPDGQPTVRLHGCGPEELRVVDTDTNSIPGTWIDLIRVPRGVKVAPALRFTGSSATVSDGSLGWAVASGPGTEPATLESGEAVQHPLDGGP
jgi:Rieske Fe-S protein